MTRTERLFFAAARDAYEAPIIAAAKAAGRCPVIDATDPGYPVPPATLMELERLENPDVRERHFRDAAVLRRKASGYRSLALTLEGKDKATQGAQLRAKAEQSDAEADALEDAVRA